ncbi:MAG: hypothetical protein CMG62_09855 [Candidatus Marinimicrobia bacterium]|nr:hypothetical protein [Candidatus Neomarinimicrobiota bacterium]
MLKITRRVEYALIAMRHLQNEGEDKTVSVKEISDKYCIPRELLAKILQKLGKHNIVISVRGSSGGYKITKNSNNIKMINFFEILEGPLGLMDCYFESNCEQLNNCNIRIPINRINDNIRDMFNKLKLSDITY